ncbi:hypothetical protein GGI21_006202 [Coemansia aciculifera]|nr:hypothetical protein GGI21_006202 [Coemansia aciculifera]
MTDPQFPDMVSYRDTCSDINSSDSSTTGSCSPTQAESSAARPTVSNIFGLLNDSTEISSGDTYTATEASVSLHLPPLELLAHTSIGSSEPLSPQMERQALRPLAVRESSAADDSLSAEVSRVNNSEPPTAQTGGSSSIEQYCATVVAGDPAKPFMCRLCGSRFGRIEHVKRHYLVHTGQRKYECNVCQKSFARSDNMLQHLRSHKR